MEINSNQILYNYNTNSNNSNQNKNANSNQEKKITSGSVRDWISYGLKNNFNKDDLIWQDVKDNHYEGWSNFMFARDTDPRGYMWGYQIANATYGNVYEDAKDFENFVNKWMEKGDTEAEALIRANYYAVAGLLDYGKQKAIMLYSDTLEYGDKKQHGFHLIDNEPLKKAFLETLDSLDGAGVAALVSNFFQDFPNKVPKKFDDMLKEYGVKLQDIQQKDENNKFNFTGDITVKKNSPLDYRNFIFDTIIGFLGDRISSIEEYEININNSDFTYLKDAYLLLIENFKKHTKKYNEDKIILNQYLKS